MSEPHVLTYGTRQIAWTLLRRDRRTLEIAVTPEGAIEAVAPLDAPLAKVEALLLKRMPWIDRQRRELGGMADAPPAMRGLHWGQDPGFAEKAEMRFVNHKRTCQTYLSESRSRHNKH